MKNVMVCWLLGAVFCQDWRALPLGWPRKTLRPLPQNVRVTNSTNKALISAIKKQHQVLVVNPPITNHMVLQDGALPPVCKAQNRITIHACRGQYEPASFVVQTTAPDTVRVTVGPLAGPNVTQWPKDAVDVRVVKEYYWRFPTRVPIGKESNAAVVPMLLVHDETFLAVEPAPTEEYPDAMTNVLRGALRDTTTLQPVHVNKRKQFWITVRSA